MIRFMYLRDAKQNPIGCLAINIDRFSGKITYGLSVLNPLDKFNRVLARKIAAERLAIKPFTAIFQCLTQLSMHDISRLVMEHILHNKNMTYNKFAQLSLCTPTRARKAAKLWLKSNSRNKE